MVVGTRPGAAQPLLAPIHRASITASTYPAMTKTERQIQRLSLRRDRLLIRIYKQRANRQDERDYAWLGRRIIELEAELKSA